MSEEVIPHDEPIVEAIEEETYEEITSDEVDSVIEVLDALLEKVQSENIRSYIEEAAANIHYLIYEDEVEETLEQPSLGESVTEAA